MCKGRPWVFFEELGVQAGWWDRRRSLKGVIHSTGKIWPAQRDPGRKVWRSQFGLHGMTCYLQSYMLPDSGQLSTRVSCGEECPIHVDASCRVGLSPDMIDFLSWLLGSLAVKAGTIPCCHVAVLLFHFKWPLVGSILALIIGNGALFVLVVCRVQLQCDSFCFLLFYFVIS